MPPECFRDEWNQGCLHGGESRGTAIGCMPPKLTPAMRSRLGLFAPRPVPRGLYRSVPRE
eukprot:2266360-Alexandrium_andersonii.AAC.1